MAGLFNSNRSASNRRKHFNWPECAGCPAWRLKPLQTACVLSSCRRAANRNSLGLIQSAACACHFEQGLVRTVSEVKTTELVIGSGKPHPRFGVVSLCFDSLAEVFFGQAIVGIKELFLAQRGFAHSILFDFRRDRRFLVPSMFAVWHLPAQARSPKPPSGSYSLTSSLSYARLPGPFDGITITGSVKSRPTDLLKFQSLGSVK